MADTSQLAALQVALIPFVGTSLGSAMVFFMGEKISPTLQRAMTGFAAGVMVAASFWSLLAPAIEEAAAAGKSSRVRSTAAI